MEREARKHGHVERSDEPGWLVFGNCRLVFTLNQTSEPHTSLSATHARTVEPAVIVVRQRAAQQAVNTQLKYNTIPVFTVGLEAFLKALLKAEGN